MREQCKKQKRTLAILGTASFYFLSVDVLADMAMAPLFGAAAFLLLRAAYMTTMSAGFLFYPVFERRFGSRWILPAAGAGIMLLFGIAVLKNPVLISCDILLSLFLGGLFGAAAYARTAFDLKGNPYLGRLASCGMGIGSLFQVLVSTFPLTLPCYALIIGAGLGLTAYLMKSESYRAPFEPEPVSVSKPELPSLRVFLLCVMLISFMGGINDGELALLQASGQVDLQAWPRLLYFAGMILAGIVFDLYGFGKLSALVLFVMICSEAGTIFMGNPSMIVLDEALYSAFAGIVIVFFTIPLFPYGGPLLPSLGRAVRLPALACGTLFHEFILRQRPSAVTIIVYVFLAALLAMLFIDSGFTAGEARHAGAGRIANEPLPEEEGSVPEDKAGDISLSPNDNASGAGAGLSSADHAPDFASFCETYGLTPREAEIMQTILRSDLPTTRLSSELHVSERTLYRHLSALYQKTGTDSRVGLLMKYYGGSEDK
ncbi:MAG: hypothetical protein IJ061_10725 [Lachnospiraceae bacterium]|nr:hypothetical protein [Lachnospiraceae bacterium]